MSNPIANSTCSDETESLETSARVVELGKRLIEEFDDQARTDTLSRWMAHYIAEKMLLADTLSGEEKEAANRSCFETILKLWNHRRMELTVRKTDFRPILQALEVLEPHSKQHRLFERHDLLSARSETDPWLQLAIRTDTVARFVIQHCIAKASAEPVLNNQELLEAARACLPDSEGGEELEALESVARIVNSVSEKRDKQIALEQLDADVRRLETLMAVEADWP